jgi:hypothetical protein
MRITSFEISQITDVFKMTFEEGSLFLFGSRIDDSKRGGDVDLYVIPKNKESLTAKKINFLVQLKKRMGECKIDVVIDRGQNRLIDQLAHKDGILLCQF